MNEKRACLGPIVAPQLEKVFFKTGGKVKAYHFGMLFLLEDSQDDVFAKLVPIIISTLVGHNCMYF